MRRLLSSPLLRYNYLQNFKKPVVEIPTSTPPKYIYQIEYHPDTMPDFDMKFKDHKHMNDWLMVVYGEQDKYEFQYSGQWWDAVTVPGRVFVVIFLILFTTSFHHSVVWRKENHLPGPDSFLTVSEISISHLPTILEN